MRLLCDGGAHLMCVASCIYMLIHPARMDFKALRPLTSSRPTTLLGFLTCSPWFQLNIVQIWMSFFILMGMSCSSTSFLAESLKCIFTTNAGPTFPFWLYLTAFLSFLWTICCVIPNWVTPLHDFLRAPCSLLRFNPLWVMPLLLTAFP